MKRTLNRSRFRALPLWVLLAGGLQCSVAYAAVTVLGVQYQQDVPYSEFNCIWNDRDYPTNCPQRSLGCNVHVYLRNTGGGSVTITDVTLAGYSLLDSLREDEGVHNARSIYFRWDNPPQAILDAGEPVWYKADPVTMPAGGVAQAVIRLRSPPDTSTVNVGVVTSAGTVTTNITVDAAAPLLASIGYSSDRTKVYLHWRRTNGAAPSAILLDGTNVTANTTTVGDSSMNFAASVINLTTALPQMSYHVFQGVYADGQVASASQRAWTNKFIYASYGNFELTANYTAADWVAEASDHGFNNVQCNVGEIGGYMNTTAGEADCRARGYGYTTGDYTKFNDIDPDMFFLEDEPDAEEANMESTFCGTGLKIPCGSSPMGILVMREIAKGEDLRNRRPMTPTNVNLDGSYRPENYYAWGQAMDVTQVDPYYQRRLSDVYWRDQHRIPLYLKATYIYAVAKATVTAAEPNPANILLFSCEWRCDSGKCDEEYVGQVWPFPTREAKRIEVYYALAAGAKGLGYWWFPKGYPSNGLADQGKATARALWYELGLLGNEIKTVAPLLVTGHPVDMPLALGTNVWAKAIASGTDTIILIAVNDNYYNDESGCHYTPVNNATLTATLPSWMQPSPTAFEISAGGLKAVSTSANGSQLQVNLGTLQLTKMIVLTKNPLVPVAIQQRYNQGVRPGICTFASALCSNSAPVIVVQPQSQTVLLSSNALFTVVASGNPLPTYQWRFNGTNLSGATSDTYTRTNAQAAHNGGYSVVVSNSQGVVTSVVATLTVSTNGLPPGIVTPPQSQTVAVGANASFTVTASGTEPLGYQWRFNSVNLSGATTNSYTRTNAQLSDAGSYDVVVTNAAGAVTSAVAVLTVTVPCPTAGLQNASFEGGNIGGVATNWTGYQRAPNPTTVWSIQIASPPAGAGAQYQQIANTSSTGGGGVRQNITGCVIGATYTISGWMRGNSALATCTVKVSPTASTSWATAIDLSPAQTYSGATWTPFSGTVFATGTNITLWLDGQTGGTDENKAECFDAVTVTCEGMPVQPPDIITPPQSQTVNEGADATFTVTASGTPPLNYQWRFNSVNIFSATATSYTRFSAQPADAGNYDVIITNVAGAITSAPATLTVTNPCAPTALVNGDFEGGTNANGVATGWTGYQRAPNPTTTWSIQTASPPTGGGLQYQQIVNTSSTGGGGVRQNITGCAVGATYSIGGWMRGNSASATCTVKVSPTASTNWSTAIDLVPAQTFTGSTWTPFSGTVVATSPSMTLWLDGQTGGTGLDKAECFDSVAVVCVDGQKPIITQQPAATNLCAGGTAMFTVAATGQGTLTYQWQTNGVNLSNGSHYAGCISATLWVTNVGSADAVSYRCVVTDDNGSSNSSEAALTLKAAPAVTSQPSAQNVCVGANAAFSVTASGGGTLTYQWQTNGVNIGNNNHYGGCTTTTLWVTNATSSDSSGVNYRCVVGGECGSVTSSVAPLNISDTTSPSITCPSNVTVSTDIGQCYASSVNLGTPLASDNCGVASMTSNAPTQFPVGTNTVTWTVTDASGNTNTCAQLVVVRNTQLPAITGQPQSRTNSVGTTATFSVTATSCTGLSYQWRKSGIPLVNGGNVIGVTAAALTINNVQQGDSGDYDVVLTNVSGSVTSSVARLTTQWKFLVYGDSRGTSSANQINTNILAELAAATTNEKPAFVLVPGDLVYSGNLSAFQGWTNIMGPVYQAGIAVYPVLGNHDTADVNAYRTVFGANLPDNGPTGETDRTYAVVYSNVLVLALDDYVTDARVNQTWIDAVVATNTRPHVFAFGHEPAFKANHTDCLDDYPSNRDTFWNSLAAVGGRVYFAGHDHFYNHARLDDGDATPGNDLHQFIVGTAGAPFHSSYAYDGVNSGWTPVNVLHEAQYGYVAVEIGGDVVTLTWKHRTAPGVYEATADVFTYAASSNLYPPTITAQPASRTNVLGTLATFSVTASGTSPLSYQWRRNGTNLVNGGNVSGITLDTLTLTGVTTNDAGSYSVVVTNLVGSVTSSPAGLTLRAATIITGEPFAQNMCAGSNAMFAVTATGEGTLTYQWQTNQVNLSNNNHYGGATAATLFITNVSGADAVNYRCVVSGEGGSATSSAPALTLRAATTISQHPSSQAVSPGSNAVFSVSASGEGMLTYQWRKNGGNLANGGHYSGVTAGTLTVTGADGNDVGNYDCVVSGGCGSVSSANATLSLLTGGVFSADYAVNRAIPDAGFVGISDTRTVSTSLHSITHLKVRLKISGTFNGDLFCYVAHGSGYSVLLNRVGRRAEDAFGYDDPGLDVTFDDAAGNDVHVYRLTVTGDHNTPLGTNVMGMWAVDGRTNNPSGVLDNTGGRVALLDAFNGLDPNGAWTVFVADLVGGDAHTLVSWGLEITGVELPPATATIYGQVQLQGFSGSGPRTVQFVASDSGGVALQTNEVSLTFTGTPKLAGYSLSVPTNTAYVSAKTAWNLRRRQGVVFSGGVATNNFTGTSGQLLGGDISQNNNLVNTADYTLLKGNWLKGTEGADITGDGLVNTADYTILKGNWLKVGDPP